MTQPVYSAEEASGLWVYLEQERGQLEGVSLELLGKGRELADALGTTLTGVLVGHGVKALAEQATSVGADAVLVVDDPRLELYVTLAYTRVVADLVGEGKPAILLLGATPNGRDLAGRLAVRLRTGLIADCTDLTLEPESGLLLGEVAGFGGGILATIKCPTSRPQMATVRPGIFPLPSPSRPAQAGTAIRVVKADLTEADLSEQVLEHVTGASADLTRASTLVVGGRGTGGDFRLVEELAGLLGGQVGATRVAVDKGWIDRERQIGQTGYVTRPKLAIVCGASGAFQFTVGIDEAETVVAIDTDAEAPIFDHADYCLVDDLFQVLPLLVEGVRAAQASGGVQDRA